MLSRIEFTNYRSFLDVKVNLAPFTLLIGANGSGKSNFLRFFYYMDTINYYVNELIENSKHFNHQNKPQFIRICTVAGDDITINSKSHDNDYLDLINTLLRLQRILSKLQVGLFTLNTLALDNPEQIQAGGKIASDGQGIISLLDDLRTGDREDLFYEIQANWIHYIPSIEKLSLRTAEPGKKSLQVREKGIKKYFPVAKLSEGTKLILMILTILYQENPPKLILLEDIDRGLHPRLFQKVVEMLRDIVKTKDIQIIATTHNPYLIDEFAGEEESVLIVEKQNAVSTITSLAERLDEGNTMEDALGSLWFSGFFGGVPKS